MPHTELSTADSKILAQVFDPESGPTKAEIIVDPYLPADRHIRDQNLLATLKAQEKEAIQLIEKFETSANSSTDDKESTYRSALHLLDNLISAHPKYASALNNRAQLRRWRYGDRNTLCQLRTSKVPERAEAALEAVFDLREAIDLATPARSGDAVAPAQGRLLGQAHTQLAALYYGASQDLESSSDFEVVAEAVQGLGQEDFEEEGSRHFYLGGLYGNEVAKALAVATNPHAKLCGRIVKEAMRKEMAGV